MANEYVPFVNFEKTVANKKVMYTYRLVTGINTWRASLCKSTPR
jgi:hypothetical protein